jgi:integrase/recombinase XerD
MMNSKGEGKNAAKPAYSKLVKGYMGFLTGRGKSLSTISSYRGDLDLFEKFLLERKRDFYELLPRDFETYQNWLQQQGLKTNTRRRKLLSAKALVKYAVSRKRVTPKQEAILFMKAPDRLERLPWIPTQEEFAAALSVVETKSLTGLRNWLVVQLLAETGLTVAELCALRWEQVGDELITLDTGKRPRKLRICANTDLHLREWRERNSGKHLFPGFNRHGVTSEKMTPRGVELFFRKIARACQFRHLKPKTLRHYCLLEWLKEGVADAEILKRLGVHPNYSLAPYKKVLETRGR